MHDYDTLWSKMQSSEVLCNSNYASATYAFRAYKLLSDQFLSRLCVEGYGGVRSYISWHVFLIRERKTTDILQAT